MAQDLPFPPYNAPFVDSSGTMSNPWQQWFQKLYARVGGALAVPNPANLSTNFSSTLISAYAPQTAAALYTTPVGQNTVIDVFNVTNNSLTDQTINVYLVPFQGTPANGNLAGTQVVPARATLSISTVVGQIVPSQGAIFVSCTASGACIISSIGRLSS